MRSPLLPKVGMRIIKTAVAVTLSYMLLVPFDLLFPAGYGGILGQIGPLYACMACIVCIQGSLEQSAHQGLARFMGVLIGGVLGILALAADEVVHHPVVSGLLLGGACVLGIWLCLLIRWPAACTMACMVPCTIIINGTVGVERYYYAAARIIETVVGVTVALLVNAVLPDHREEEPK